MVGSGHLVALAGLGECGLHSKEYQLRHCQRRRLPGGYLLHGLYVPAGWWAHQLQVHRDLRLAGVARRLAFEAGTSQIIDALGRAGVGTILLKGPSIERWLYQPDEIRGSADIDLFVALVDDRCDRAFAELGFDPVPGTAGIIGDRPQVGRTYFRAADSMLVELHEALIATPEPESNWWEVLRSETEELELSGATVPVLNEEARTLNVALHAAGHGIEHAKSMEDLRRALRLVPVAVWDRAAELARRTRSMATFTSGLRLLPEGEAIAQRYGGPSSTNDALYARQAPPASFLFEWLRTFEGAGPKVRFILRKLVPPRAFMMDWFAPAKHFPVLLVVAYPYRLIWATLIGFRGLLYWLAARSEVSKVTAVEEVEP